MKTTNKTQQAIQYLIDNPTLTVEGASLATGVRLYDLLKAFEREANLLRGVCPTCKRKLLPTRKHRPVPSTQDGEPLPILKERRQPSVKAERHAGTERLRRAINTIKAEVAKDQRRGKIIRNTKYISGEKWKIPSVSDLRRLI